MNHMRKLMIASLIASTSVAAELIPSRGTVAVRPRYRHQSEVEAEKRTAKQAEIAEWNARIEGRRK